MPKESRAAKRKVTIIASDLGAIDPIRGATIAIDGRTWLNHDGDPEDGGQIEFDLHPGLYAVSVTLDGETAERPIRVRYNANPKTYKIAVAKNYDVGSQFTYTVNVYDLNGGAPVAGATIVLDPRQSGLDDPPPTGTTNANGVCALTVNNSGRYDIEASHPNYYTDTHLKKYVSGGASDTFYLEHE